MHFLKIEVEIVKSLYNLQTFADARNAFLFYTIVYTYLYSREWAFRKMTRGGNVSCRRNIFLCSLMGDFFRLEEYFSPFRFSPHIPLPPSSEFLEWKRHIPKTVCKNYRHQGNEVNWTEWSRSLHQILAGGSKKSYIFFISHDKARKKKLKHISRYVINEIVSTSFHVRIWWRLSKNITFWTQTDVQSLRETGFRAKILRKTKQQLNQ